LKSERDDIKVAETVLQEKLFKFCHRYRVYDKVDGHTKREAS
jgi:hypothetical protein